MHARAAKIKLGVFFSQFGGTPCTHFDDTLTTAAVHQLGLFFSCKLSYFVVYNLKGKIQLLLLTKYCVCPTRTEVKKCPQVPHWPRCLFSSPHILIQLYHVTNPVSIMLSFKQIYGCVQVLLSSAWWVPKINANITIRCSRERAK